MGRDIAGPAIGESRMTDLLASICSEQGWPHVRQPVHPGRENLLALIAGAPLPDEGGELLLWDVHQDTVAVEGMTIAPFGGEARDGRVYGRGASDVKGSMAAMLAALSRVTETRPERRPTIVLACSANEECGFTGARVLAESWAAEQPATAEKNSAGSLLDDSAFLATNLFRRRPDAVIVAEPTQFNPIVAHNGVVRWRCHTHGKAAHTSLPDLGVNAIFGMVEIVRAVKQFHQELTASGVSHPLCGKPSATVSTIRGGVGVNTVPEHAMIEVERRLMPSESPVAAYEELISYISANTHIAPCRVEHEQPYMHSNGLLDHGNREVAEKLAAFAREQGRDVKIVGAPYGTDGAAFSVVGVPTVVFGPGSIDQAHTADEFIEIEELELGAEIFYQIACGGLRQI